MYVLIHEMGKKKKKTRFGHNSGLCLLNQMPLPIGQIFGGLGLVITGQGHRIAHFRASEIFQHLNV